MDKAIIAREAPKHKDRPDLTWPAIVLLYEKWHSSKFEAKKILHELDALVPGDNRLSFMTKF